MVIHNVRSAHNVGSMLRTAEGLGAAVYLTGYTPYPAKARDQRLPHIALKTSRRIAKTALGAETSVKWQRYTDISRALTKLKQDGYFIAALEQDSGSRSLNEFAPPAKTALIVGPEVEGLDQATLALADTILEIPMQGKKESYNVSVAAGIALFHSRFETGEGVTPPPHARRSPKVNSGSLPPSGSKHG